MSIRETSKSTQHNLQRNSTLIGKLWQAFTHTQQNYALSKKETPHLEKKALVRYIWLISTSTRYINGSDKPWTYMNGFTLLGGEIEGRSRAERTNAHWCNDLDCERSEFGERNGSQLEEDKTC